MIVKIIIISIYNYIDAVHSERRNRGAEAEDTKKAGDGRWKREEMGREGEDVERRASVVQQRMEELV